ncbi:MAG: VWA domain-containing protein [Candidatus Eiseniibacteriota bacterium]
MMRPRRELNIFSISALDLFASAMGAFILIAVILFPYYLKNNEVVAERDQARKELAETRRDLADARRAQAAAEQKARDAEARAKASAEESARLKERNTQLERQARTASVVSLLGLTTNAKSFVILVDMSGSMHDHAQVVFRTFERILEPMDASMRLQIIGFSAPANNIPRLIQWRPGLTLTALTPEAKQQAIAFVRELAQRFDGGTPTQTALREALKYSAQAIILMSDGAPTDNPIQEILDDITRVNGGRMEIDTVAIGDYNKYPPLVLFLQELAKRNRGAFTGVSG